MAVVEEQIVKPYHQTDRFSLYEGDCRSVLPIFSDCYFDSVVCDPPYELGFMGKGWDRSGIAYDVPVWRECLRVLKPGGHLLAFGGSRTYHRLACAIEDAGFEIRDQIQWIYASGFPKSLNVARSIDSEVCEIAGRHFWTEAALPKADKALDGDHVCPVTQDGLEHEGEGTALKPAQEILTVAYKPHGYDAERDKIDANLSLLEARLWLLLPASIAEKHFQLSPQEYVEVCGSVQMDADEWRSIRDGLLGQMDTSRCVSVMSTCLNTVRSWRSTLDAFCEVTSTSTIETKTSLITDLRILNYSLSQTTPSIIIKAASQADGQALNALPVAQHFAAARLKLNGILTLSALDAATSKAHTLHRAATASNGIVLARKPLEGTVAANVLKYGTGGLNIDGCRIAVEDCEPNKRRATGTNGGAQSMFGVGNSTRPATLDNARWPANVIHDGSEEVLAEFPHTESGYSDGTKSGIQRVAFGKYGAGTFNETYGDSGSAARFFYCAKATQEDRNEGLEDLPIHNTSIGDQRPSGSMSQRIHKDEGRPDTTGRNAHPTVKPTALMRYLCRLITPPGGIVLDPFCGSGSTGKAAMLEGFKFIGIELSADYCQLAQLRIEAVTRQGLLFA